MLKVFDLEANWPQLSARQKECFWKKLRQLQTIADIIDIFPEEILLSMEDIIFGFKEVYDPAKDPLEQITDSIMGNDLMLHGMRKLLWKVQDYVQQQRIPVAPSYTSLMEKSENIL